MRQLRILMNVSAFLPLAREIEKVDAEAYLYGSVARGEDVEGKLEAKYTLDFEACMGAREDADYRLEYSEERAEASIGIAKGFLSRVKKLVAGTGMTGGNI